MSKYDLSKFVSNEVKAQGVLDFGNFEVVIIENAFTYASIQAAFTEHKDKADKLANKILDIAIKPEDKKKILDLNMSVEGKEVMIASIISHIFGVKQQELQEAINTVIKTGEEKK